MMKKTFLIILLFLTVSVVKSQFLGKTKQEVKSELTSGKSLYVVDWVERPKESTITYKDKDNPEETNTCYFHQYGICSSLIKQVPNKYLKTYLDVFNKTYTKTKENEWVSNAKPKTFIRLTKEKDFFRVIISYE